ncbi:MAG: bis(5'-nucleosyl)-tetraphosphatase (symmetrical) YqeK [Lachnospiraceae bacterium]|nr:bis(5'-nucleosyl)-tetraphosphatase (symmetrical) YqeK [Lachnospiraceae bacterium]
MNIDLYELTEQLRKILPVKRFNHTLGVGYMCSALAMRYNCDIYRAQLSGLLHDCAKYLSSKEILEECLKNEIKVSEEESNHPHLLHGRLGAYYAKNIYGVDDEEVLNAIEYHTTGHPDMSLLEKILFISDYIEPSRKMVKGLQETRDMAFIDIDKSLILKIESVLNYLNERECFIDELTLKTYDFYK